jgi:hypothetical protein
MRRVLSRSELLELALRRKDAHVRLLLGRLELQGADAALRTGRTEMRGVRPVEPMSARRGLRRRGPPMHPSMPRHRGLRREQPLTLRRDGWSVRRVHEGRRLPRARRALVQPLRRKLRRMFDRRGLRSVLRMPERARVWTRVPCERGLPRWDPLHLPALHAVKPVFRRQH